MNDQVCIVATEVVTEHWDFKAYWKLQIKLAVSSVDKPACDVVEITDLGTLRLTLNKLVTADVAPSDIIILLLLARAKALHLLIRPENRHDFCFPLDESVKKLGERVLSYVHHGSFVKVIKT